MTVAPALVAGVLRRFGRARVRVTGGSMFPVIQSGDTLTVEHCAADAIGCGDVVLMLEGTRLYAHRLIATTMVDGERWLVTRGDSHWRRDPPRPVSSLLGRVVEVERGDRVIAEPFRASPIDRLRGLAASEWTRVRMRARRWLPAWSA